MDATEAIAIRSVLETIRSSAATGVQVIDSVVPAQEALGFWNKYQPYILIGSGLIVGYLLRSLRP